MSLCHDEQRAHPAPPPARRGERGSALAMSLLILALVTVISASVLAVVTTEGGIAGGDLERTRTYYAALASLEVMTNRFSALFSRTSYPSAGELNAIAASFPTELVAEGFTFNQTLVQQGGRREVVIPNGPFAGLNASVVPYVLSSTATVPRSGTQVGLRRDINNYLVPIFQFGVFSDEDLEIHPGPPMFFNGRVHANGNLYLNGDTTFLSKVTTANEAVTSVMRNGFARAPDVKFRISGVAVPLTLGSVSGGPNLPPAQQLNGRGVFPLHPPGAANPVWEATSVAAANGTANQFGGRLLTRTTGGSPLLLPLQLGGASPREIIKRALAAEAVTAPVLHQSRYHTKAAIRILVDDEAQPADAAGIPAGRGVALSSFVPSELGGGRALLRVGDDGTYYAADAAAPALQKLDPPPAPSPAPTPAPRLQTATTVRGVQAAPVYNAAGDPASGVRIPQGAGLTGRILIEIVAPGGAALDVTQAVLSMGVTEGEPNGIVYLQRPLWASFTQGSRDREAANRTSLVYLTDSQSTAVAHNTRAVVDGEINETFFNRNATYGYYSVTESVLDDDPHDAAAPLMPTGGPVREAFPTGVNRVVPINLYNVREGAIHTSLFGDVVYERGITSVVELNMRNLARWVVGTFDSNLLAGTQAVSANIGSAGGCIVYVSDRRGDRVRNGTTNGVVDNEDIYGFNGTLDPGEDVDGDGALSNDAAELPNPAALVAAGINARAEDVASWSNPNNFFRRAVRLFNGETLAVTGPAGSLSATRGLTIAAENMLYVWGNYNTTGITAQPAGGATLNDGGYTGPQVPASVAADALFPLSKTWFDSSSAMYPQGGSRRPADANLPAITDSTSVRTAVIAGSNLSALMGDPSAGNGGNPDERRLGGGLHNFPRFLENWGGVRWNFVGSLVPLYRSTQAVGPYNSNGAIYGPPVRNWAFDISFTDPARLPPGTPVFQYVEPTGFRQIFR